MLFALTAAPVAPMRMAFPGVRFPALAGRCPVLLWFSRIREIGYTGADGAAHRDGGPDAVLYYELNVIALLWRAFFVPVIYATSERTIRVGHAYGMPKERTHMALSIDGRDIASAVRDGSRESFVRARILGSGTFLPRILRRFWPWRAWPALFPGNGAVRAVIQETPRAYLTAVRAGHLSLDEAWLPGPLGLFPLGAYVPALRMRLPSPSDSRGRS